MQNSVGIFWLRDDFRQVRNDALSFASQNHEKVVVVYLYKKDFLNYREAQKWWLYKSLENFKKDLGEKNISLEVLECASFQEMTVAQVENYKTILESILKSKTISLIVYKGWEKNNTLSPDEINKVFNEKLKISEFDNFNNNEKLVYLTS